MTRGRRVGGHSVIWRARCQDLLSPGQLPLPPPVWFKQHLPGGQLCGCFWLCLGETTGLEFRSAQSREDPLLWDAGARLLIKQATLCQETGGLRGHSIHPLWLGLCLVGLGGTIRALGHIAHLLGLIINTEYTKRCLIFLSTHALRSVQSPSHPVLGLFQQRPGSQFVLSSCSKRTDTDTGMGPAGGLFARVREHCVAKRMPKTGCGPVVYPTCWPGWCYGRKCTQTFGEVSSRGLFFLPDPQRTFLVLRNPSHPLVWHHTSPRRTHAQCEHGATLLVSQAPSLP